MRLVVVSDKRELTDFFGDTIDSLECQKLTKAYVLDLLVKYIRDNNYSAKDSLTFIYRDAIAAGSFAEIQELADYLLYTKSLFPRSLQGASTDYYNSLARSAYYKCYLMLQRQWLIYEELADQFNYLTEAINESFYAVDQGSSFSSGFRG